MKFNELNISEKIIKNIEKLGYTNLTPIQEKTIPIMLECKDLIGIASTGSGKTLAYSIPLIERIIREKKEKKAIKTLILVPTRELAVQVKNEINSISFDTVNTCVIMGGVSESKQLFTIKKGVDILIATPGRLNDLIKRRKISLAAVDKIVLDEADTMLDMGFINDINTIMSKVASNRQILLFTATYKESLNDIVLKYLNNPIKVTIPSLEEKPQIEEQLYFIDSKNKNEFLLEYISKNRVTEAIIFTKTKIAADKLCEFLNSYGLKSIAIHSNKRQSERSRNLRLFKEKKVKFLIATDIAARGIDIKALPYVINYNLPDQAEMYIHRIGRTGRAGEKGIAISIATPLEKKYLKDIEALLGQKLPVIKDDKFSIELKQNNNKKNYNRNNNKSFDKRNKNMDKKWNSNNKSRKSSSRNTNKNTLKNYSYNKRKNKSNKNI